MARSIRFASVLALAGALLVGGTVSGDSGGARILDASMVGIPAGAAGMFSGVQGGGRTVGARQGRCHGCSPTAGCRSR